MATLANGEDLDEMQRNGSELFAKIKTTFRQTYIIL